MQKSQLPRELVTKTHAKKPTAERVGNCDSSKSQLPKELVTAQKINLPNELVTAIPPAGLRAASPIPTSTTALSKLSLQTCWDFPTKHSLWLASFGLVSHGFHRLGLASFGLWLRSLVTSRFGLGALRIFGGFCLGLCFGQSFGAIQDCLLGLVLRILSIF